MLEPAKAANVGGHHTEPYLSSDRIERGSSANAYRLLPSRDAYDALRAKHIGTPVPLSLTAIGDAQADPWGIAAGAVGAAIGTLLGGGVGGLGGGASGTLVAPGIATIGGGIAGGVEGATLGGVAGAGVGYGVASAVHGLINRMKQSSSTGGSDAAGGPQKPDPVASKPYREDPERLAGRCASDVEKELDRKLVNDGHWMKSPSRDGNGVRYVDNKGGSLIINRGYPSGMPGGDSVHEGPYVKIQPGGIRVPLAPTLAVGS